MESVDLQLKNRINKAIEHFNYETALFLAERLVTIDKTCADYSYLLAKVHYLMGNTKFASSILDCTGYHGASVILYANCCLKLSLYKQGQEVVQRYIEQNLENELSAVAYLMLGKLCKYLGFLIIGFSSSNKKPKKL